ncbi:MAG: DUF4159 domain-containing protein [Rariglobus sp.]
MSVVPRVRVWLTALLLTADLLYAAPAEPTNPPPNPAPRGGRVGWARLISDDPEWRRHARSDSGLSDFIKSHTSLNLEPAWQTADATKPEELGRFPLLFSTGLATFRDDDRRKNLREYLDRGGFLIIDACINRDLTPDPDRFLAENTTALSSIVPGGAVKPLAADHAIYACFFNLRDKPPHTYHDAVFDSRWARHPLNGVFNASGRLCAVLSLSGLQCGWDRMPGPEGHTEQCMQMVVNIYVHAMTR